MPRGAKAIGLLPEQSVACATQPDSCRQLSVAMESSTTRSLDHFEIRTELYDSEVAREIWLHAQLAHPAVIALYAAWKDKDHIYLCMEYSTEGNVWGFMMSMGGKLNERTAVPLVLEPALSALSYLHDLGIIHRGAAMCCWDLHFLGPCPWKNAQLGARHQQPSSCKHCFFFVPCVLLTMSIMVLLVLLTRYQAREFAHGQLISGLAHWTIWHQRSWRAQ
ncbi:aurora protein, partial [Haematococcus lacustris]